MRYVSNSVVFRFNPLVFTYTVSEWVQMIVKVKYISCVISSSGCVRVYISGVSVRESSLTCTYLGCHMNSFCSFDIKDDISTTRRNWSYRRIFQMIRECVMYVGNPDLPREILVMPINWNFLQRGLIDNIQASGHCSTFMFPCLLAEHCSMSVVFCFYR